MCVIIDADVAGHVFANPCHQEFVPLWDWVLNKDGCIVYGGHLAKELGRIRKTEEGVRGLKVLSDAGRAYRQSDEIICSEKKRVLAMGVCRMSNDLHVIALARTTGARTLCSADKNLHADFKNPALVPSPRGRVYQYAKDAHLLRHTKGCVGRPR